MHLLLPAICFFVWCVLPAAGQGQLSGPFTFVTVDGTAKITKYACPIEPHPLYVPDNLKGTPVTVIDSGAFTGCDSILGALVPVGVVEIGNSAFWNCRGLRVVGLPPGLKRIGTMAFYGCAGLDEITIPGDVEFIGEYAFAGCEALKTIAVDPENQHFASRDGLLVSKDGHRLVQFPYAMGNHFRVPGGIHEIGSHAFADARALTGVEIPSSVKTIGTQAFANAFLLATVTIEEGLVAVHEQAFSGCRQLKSIVLPATVKSIGSGAFKDCQQLAEVHFAGTPPENTKDIFAGTHAGLTIYYPAGTPGWGDSWAGRPAKPAP